MIPLYSFASLYNIIEIIAGLALKTQKVIYIVILTFSDGASINTLNCSLIIYYQSK